MIAVAMTNTQTWSVSITGEELLVMQGIADVLRTDVKGVITKMIVGGIKACVQLTGDMFGDDTGK